jgi:Xaa-Pro aminopeptidase
MKSLRQVKKTLTDQNADALLISFQPHIRWGTGFSGSNGLLLVSGEACHLVTDGRYRDQARAETPSEVTVHIASNGLSAYMAEEGLLDAYDAVAFQSEHVTVEQLDAWRDRFDHVEWVAAPGVLTERAGVKSEAEVDAIAAAQAITDAVFEELVDFIAPGQTEQEVAAELVYRHLKRGAEKMSFDPIVASGPNGALPHARPTDRRLRRGDLVVIDMGCFLEGYASDMTRTVAIGEPGEEMVQAYDAVLDAQEAAIAAAQAGMTAKELDGVARDVLVSHDLGDAFSHGLGHGVGLQIHEWPRVSRTSDDTLPAGAVVTIEPGVYLSDRFGIRIEDIIVLEEGGCRNLTSSPKALRRISG